MLSQIPFEKRFYDIYRPARKTIRIHYCYFRLKDCSGRFLEVVGLQVTAEVLHDPLGRGRVQAAEQQELVPRHVGAQAATSAVAAGEAHEVEDAPHRILLEGNPVLEQDVVGGPRLSVLRGHLLEVQEQHVRGDLAPAAAEEGVGLVEVAEGRPAPRGEVNNSE